MKIVITDNRFGDEGIERSILEAAGVELAVGSCASSADVVAACGDADGILVNLAPIDSVALESLPRCRVVSRYGVGLDNIDVEAARRLGIAVRNVPGYCDREVAEHCLGLLLALARGIAARDRSIRAGLWNAISPGRRVAGTTLGILGFGGTARSLARSALALGFEKILVWSPRISAARIEEALGPLAVATGVRVLATTFDTLIAQSDWITVNLSLTPETRGLIDARAFAMMKKDACLVNVARGPIVEEEALVDALESGKLGGAGLDVFAAEPLPRGSALRSAPNVILTDHSAFASRESIGELRTACAKNALEVLFPK